MFLKMCHTLSHGIDVISTQLPDSLRPYTHKCFSKNRQHQRTEMIRVPVKDREWLNRSSPTGFVSAKMNSEVSWDVDLYLFPPSYQQYQNRQLGITKWTEHLVHLWVHQLADMFDPLNLFDCLCNQYKWANSDAEKILALQPSPMKMVFLMFKNDIQAFSHDEWRI